MGVEQISVAVDENWYITHAFIIYFSSLLGIHNA